MLTRALPIALLVVLSFEFQAGANAQVSPAQESPMQTPPAVSVRSYQVETGMEERSNYLSVGATAGGGYIDNFYAGTSTSQGRLGEGIISLQPTVAFDATSARQQTTVSYSPTFIFYEPNSELNEADEGAAVNFRYRFSPRLTMDLTDSLLRASTGFGQFGNGGISGSAQTTTPGVILPYGERFTNSAVGGLSYQLSPHGMIGGSGNVSNLTFPKNSEFPGLYNSDSRGGGVFYTYRLSESQYLGGTYEYGQVLSYSTGEQYDTQTHTIYGFYTIYLTQGWSISVSGGPQDYIAAHAPFPTTRAWTPAIMASTGWQSRHTSFAANFSRTVTGGGGLLGAFHSTGAGASAKWEISRVWNAGLDINYAINKSATPLLEVGSQGGHTFATSLTLNRVLTNHFNAGFRYDRLDTHYSGIPSAAINPNSDRFMLSITWQFLRPVGR
jgi:hypothetical protein